MHRSGGEAVEGKGLGERLAGVLEVVPAALAAGEVATAALAPADVLVGGPVWCAPIDRRRARRRGRAVLGEVMSVLMAITNSRVAPSWAAVSLPLISIRLPAEK
jgi:hypothetical protein